MFSARVAAPSTPPLREIKSIVFESLSPDEIKAVSVIHVTSPELYGTDGKPKPCGLLDPRMGTSDRSTKCATCESDMIQCCGHIGHIELATPVFHTGFIDRLKKILEIVCSRCFRIRIDVAAPENGVLAHKLKNDPKERFGILWKHTKTKTSCDHCGFHVYSVRYDNGRLAVQSTKEARQMLTGEDAHAILSKIADADVECMGMSDRHGAVVRPEWFLVSVLVVPPPCIRPSVMMDGGSSQDDLTIKLADIIRTNDQVNKYKDPRVRREKEKIYAEFADLLQYHVNTYFDNSISGQQVATQKSGRPLRSITARLKGKEGRLRGNIMGKRVDFSARTVITGDPNISIEEVGVPFQVATNMTFPERVTAMNMGWLQRLVDAGPGAYPGAKYVIAPEGTRIDLRFRKEPIFLGVGWTVHRHMLNGDVVLFNRQPTLHKMSMMGHRVRVMPGKTFRLNLSVTSPYNADFDGDEMNLHSCLSYPTQAELSTLSMVSEMFVSPQSNKPVMGIVQDALVAIHLMTRRDVFIGREMAMQITMHSPREDMCAYGLPPPAILKPVPMWTGKQLVSLAFPDINLNGFTSDHPDGERTYNSPGDTRVMIRNGELIAGKLCKKTVGTSQGGLIHVVFKDHGGAVTRDMIDNIQYIVNHWLLHHGHSVGVGDMIIPKRVMKKIDKAVGDSIEDASTQMEEATVNRILNKARDTAGHLAQRQLSACNNVKKMVVAGSKGSYINISQMAACVGQQNVEGKRIPWGFQDRSLPHFSRYDPTPLSRGFVASSYIKGLKPAEFFFHAMGGREGLIDTAVKTSDTGYIQRRLVKALEDVLVQYDGTVRNSRGHIVQFVYGEDGMDGTAPERQFTDIQMLTPEQIRDRMSWVPLKVSDVKILPVNLKRIIKSVTSDLTIPFEPIATLNSLFTSPIDEQSDTSLLLFRLHVRTTLSSKQIVTQRIGRLHLEEILRVLTKQFRKGVVQPGEMVGVVAAQSLGENITQLTLNTFHLAGVANSLMLGVPRLRELINVVKNIKTPRTIMKLLPDAPAHKVVQELVYKRLYDFATEISVHYDPHLELDNDLVGHHYLFSDEPVCCPWVLRVEFNRQELLVQPGWQMSQVAALFERSFPNTATEAVALSQSYFQCFYTDDNNDRCVMHVRFREDIETQGDMENVNEFMEVTGIEMLKSGEVVVSGINLEGCFMVPYIDPYSIKINDPAMVLQTLGVEAARQCLLDELRTTIEFDGSYINYRHIALLVDVMTSRGGLMSITRHGINRADAGPIAMSSFEETTDILFDAAAQGTVDRCDGVTEKVLLAQLYKGGSGLMDVLLDEEKFMEMEVAW
ncbi:uncharacterized protein BJ171DRAFT_498337 [Polychytrium aggregatum]|uniref:uncharacterized protein n=1 Tax=Polychytrium aggregatum TaxID=110093 RepID=UPI0022FDD4C2|nr:uncharacterized protein BJ171DRAFT_498337 [Polychytrium aggregatum]KAI9205990.1 hypothetical protein BJ171DRAFT_498337 [Polychytrium aggregatum]